MRHTFLFEEGIWKAQGIYVDGTNTPLGAEGSITITHAENLWINEGSLYLLLATPIEFRNRYEIIPFREGRDHTSWTSLNPVIGKLSGKIVVVDDSLISSYESEDRHYTGAEYLLQVSEGVYKNKGFAFKDEELMALWSVELTRIG